MIDKDIIIHVVVYKEDLIIDWLMKQWIKIMIKLDYIKKKIKLMTTINGIEK